MSKCDKCLCKTCAIAYYNGGAEECGDCWICEDTPNQHPVTLCWDYYNPSPREIKESPYENWFIEKESQE